MPYFHESLYQFDELQPSWWEASVGETLRMPTNPLSSDEQCEVAIIGGGYTGLSAAYHLAKDYNIDVSVLEAGEIGWGSSGRNGGFCCIGGTMLGVGALVRKFGLSETKRFFDAQKQAVELVAEITEAEDIDAEAVADCEMVVAEKAGHFDALREEHDFLSTKLEVDCELIGQDQFRETCYDAPHQHGALLHRPGFALHPLKYCLGLARSAERHGVNLRGGSKVVKWWKEGQHHRLLTASGGSLKARHVIVACNGFMPEHLHDGIKNRVMPLQSQIIVTRPLLDDEMAAYKWKTSNPAINSRNVYNYFRMLPGNRLLMGGRADFSGSPESAEVTAGMLKDQITRFWPEWKDIDIDYSWRGFVCFTRNLRPAIGRLPDDTTVSMAYGYHGNGVNNATWSGRELAKWLATGNDAHSHVPDHLPEIVRGVSPTFPFPRLRRRYAQAGIAWHKLKDAFDRA